MKLQKILCLFLCLVFMVPQGITFVSAASSTAGEESAETTFNFDEYDYSDPSLRIENFPKDDEFFGVWDEETGTWTTEPKFDYSHVSQYGGYDMSEVEAYVKEGNYEGAKEALLEYYRQMNAQRGMKVLTEDADDNGLSRLMLYNMHDMAGGSYHLADIFSVGSEWETIGIDMLETVKYYIALGSTTTLPIGLYSLTKDDYEAVFYSKDSDYAPYLEMVVNGFTEIIPLENDTYIAAGDYVNENYGRKEYLYSRESSIGQRNPVDSDTRRVFMTLNLSDYDRGDTITYAQLKLRGKWIDKQSPERGDTSYEKKLAAITDLNTNWKEDTLTWMTNVTPIFSYEGEFGTNWLQPMPEVNPDQVYEEHLFRFAWLQSLTATYTNSGDETYARAMFMYLHDFIEKTYNVYRGMEGGWEYPAAHNSVEEAQQLIHGGYSKSLDLSVRASNVTQYLPYYFDSEYMTPELFTVFTKYIWAMGDLLSRFWGRSEKAGNWGNYSNKGFYTIMAYYPEFAAVDEWMPILYERVDSHLESRFLEDGSSEEGSTSYTWSNLNNLYATKILADNLGIELDYPESVKNNLARLTQYCMNLLLPWGGDPGFGDGTTHTGSYLPNVYNMGDWLDVPEFLYVGSGGKEGTAPDYTSVYYDFRKFMMMRSAWDEDALYLYTSVSSSPYSHNHWDDLNVIVAAYGAYLLIDPGFYTLETNDISGRNLKSSLSHNTLSINGYCTRKYTAPHLNGDVALPNDGKKGDFEYVEFNDHYDFVREVTENNKSIQYLSDPKSTDAESEAPPFEPGMDSARNILFLRPNFWIVSDYMKPVDSDGPEGNGNTYSQIWHTLPDSNLKIDGQYVLQRGETIGDINVGEFASEIENTHFVPGTGNGALRTNVHSSANILVVPADVKKSEGESGVTPKLLRGLYSPMKGSVTTTPYGVFEQTVKGTAVFDTVLFPTRKGEKYDITTMPNTVKTISDGASLPQGAGSFFSANIKNISGNNNDDYNFSYYILHEVDKQTDVEFGSYSTDGMLAYYEEEQDTRPRNAIMKNATYIGDEANDYKLVYSEELIEDISVRWENGEILIASDDDVIDLTRLTIYSYYNPSKVFLNGEEVAHNYESNYVYFGNEPILNGSSIVLPGTPSVDNPTDNGSNTPSHGTPSTGREPSNGGYISGGNTSSGTSGGSGSETENNAKSDAFSAELENHWGKTEIEYLIDNNIVNGDGSILNLESNVTRAEFIAMIVRALELETVPYSGAFADVSEKDWYAEIIQTAYEANIISGTEKGAEPDAQLTREQAVKIMAAALKLEVSEETSLEFADENKISLWAKPFVAKAAALGLINGMGNNIFAPQSCTLREQAMVMIYRMLENLDDIG